MEENNVQNYHLPLIGDPAPEFKAQTTQGPIDFPKDYKGKWVILFSHPADFTPVCTSEFITFASMHDQFKQANCELVGLSVDAIQSHIAWLKTIKDKIEFNGHSQVEVKFPLIDDITMNVAKKYGMIQPGESNTKAVRAVFYIDPEGIVRAIMYYPLSVGRNFDELYRTLLALKVNDEFGYSTPADWRPGDNVIIGAPSTCEEAKTRMETHKDDIECKDWFFCTKKLSKETVLDKILKKK